MTQRVQVSNGTRVVVDTGPPGPPGPPGAPGSPGPPGTGGGRVGYDFVLEGSEVSVGDETWTMLTFGGSGKANYLVNCDGANPNILLHIDEVADSALGTPFKALLFEVDPGTVFHMVDPSDGEAYIVVDAWAGALDNALTVEFRPYPGAFGGYAEDYWLALGSPEVRPRMGSIFKAMESVPEGDGVDVPDARLVLNEDGSNAETANSNGFGATFVEILLNNIAGSRALRLEIRAAVDIAKIRITDEFGISADFTVDDLGIRSGTTILCNLGFLEVADGDREFYFDPIRPD